MPGSQCENWKEVMENLSDLMKGKDVYKEQRIHTLELFNSYVDTDNSKRVVKEIKNILGKNQDLKEKHD
ncbi:MAG: CDP-glycerol glycerophosphotransferase family protein [Calditrichaceae bacterium]